MTGRCGDCAGWRECPARQYQEPNVLHGQWTIVFGARINLFAYQAHCQSSIPCLADNSDDRLWTIVLEEESIELPKFQW